MTDSTFEEAKRCFKCQQPGVQISESLAGGDAGRKGARVKVFKCDNELCLNYRETWIVQVNRDGSIPTRQKGEKQFIIPSFLENAARRNLEQLKHEMEEGTL